MSPPIKQGPSLGVQRWRGPWVCLALAAIIFAVFGQTLHHEFINYDDDDYVRGNPMVAQGLTLKSIIRAFTTGHASNWHPLTWLSHMLDCQLYGLRPGGHHLTNVLLHAAAAIALFLVLRRMTGAFWRSALVAAVFAIHPLRVESVAWVAERKDVLSGLFFMLTLAAYARRAGPSVLVMLWFALGLMSKPMLVTLPVILLLLDYWPLRRMETGKFSGLVVEKLPLFVLSAASCLVTLWAQHAALQSIESVPLPLRFANALVACAIYLGQMVYPVGLAVLYPYPHHGLPLWKVGGAGILLAGLSAMAFCQRRKRPWLLVGWLWYLVMLLPVLGLIQVGEQPHADRYTYLPQIGIYLAVIWQVSEWSAKCSLGVAAAVLGVLMFCAWKQTAYWQNSETLWNHTIVCTTGNYAAHYNLAIDLMKKGGREEAIAQYRQALRIEPDYTEARNNLAEALRRAGNLDEAIAQFHQAVQADPNSAEVHYNFALALGQKGQVDDAIAQYQKALAIKPNYADAHNNLGNLLRQQGKLDDAIAHYQRAVEINPGFPDARNNLGDVFRQQGKWEDAIAQFEQALQENPAFAEAHYNLGTAFLQTGRVEEAVIEYQNALQINPEYAEAQGNLGNILAQMGKMSEAISHFQKSLQIAPANPAIQNSMAWLLATGPDAALRNGRQAVALAQQAGELTGGKNPFILRTLAAAFAESGRFSEAVATARRALSLVQDQTNARLTEQLRLQLKAYEAGLPWHPSSK